MCNFDSIIILYIAKVAHFLKALNCIYDAFFMLDL